MKGKAMTKTLGIIVGSLRRDSWNRRVAEKVAALLPDSVEARFIDISKLPFYNEDDDKQTPPASYVEFRKELDECDGFLFATPEYNRSFPGLIKNAIDVGSRPYGKSKWNGKPAALISASPGTFGGIASSLQLQQTLGFLNLKMLRQPEVALSHIHKAFDKEGNLDERTGAFLKDFAEALAAHLQ